MININDIVAKVSETKDLIADQTFTDLSKKANTGGITFDVAEGLGDNANITTVLLINSGGYPDQRIQAVMNYPAPTVAGFEEIGVVARLLSFDSPDASYYYARVDAGVAKITRVLNGTFSTLTSSAFALAQGVNVTITLTCVGDLISATFDAGGTPATVNLSVTDSAVAQRGVLGFRSSNSAMWCRSLEWSQL